MQTPRRVPNISEHTAQATPLPPALEDFEIGFAHFVGSNHLLGPAIADLQVDD